MLTLCSYTCVCLLRVALFFVSIKSAALAGVVGGARGGRGGGAASLLTFKQGN